MSSALIQAIFIEPWPFWAGGILIGLLVPLLYYFFNTALGVSTGYGNLVKISLPSRNLKWIKSDYAETFSWRVFFIAGIIIGGFISARLADSPGFTLEMGRFTGLVQWPVVANAIYFFVGGILLGLGARIAGGCTSGHSIHGIANLHISSILATILFIIGGIIAANLVRAILMGGAW
jgi:uncharacterized protein